MSVFSDACRKIGNRDTPSAFRQATAEILRCAQDDNWHLGLLKGTAPASLLRRQAEGGRDKISVTDRNGVGGVEEKFVRAGEHAPDWNAHTQRLAGAIDFKVFA